jgi:hypothetical protein
LKAFEFTFQVEIFYLMAIEVRFEKFCGINLRAAAMADCSLISYIVKINVRLF